MSGKDKSHEYYDMMVKDIIRAKKCVCRGPGVEGVAPAEASERLQSFQAEFEQLWRKYTTYSGGEELFGLHVNGTR